jgi:hypothetical protein
LITLLKQSNHASTWHIEHAVRQRLAGGPGEAGRFV